MASLTHDLITTGFDFQGFRITKYLGLVRGITVRSRSVIGSELCEQSRQEAYDLMVRHANEIGANAVIGVRYDATELMSGVTEVLAYGTAVTIERIG